MTSGRLAMALHRPVHQALWLSISWVRRHSAVPPHHSNGNNIPTYLPTNTSTSSHPPSLLSVLTPLSVFSRPRLDSNHLIFLTAFSRRQPGYRATLPSGFFSSRLCTFSRYNDQVKRTYKMLGYMRLRIAFEYVNRKQFNTQYSLI